MFNQKTKDTINGWGQILRFITPILITIALWIMSDMKTEIKDIRENTKQLTIKMVEYNTNHLEHHRISEIKICERLASIETMIREKLFNEK